MGLATSTTYDIIKTFVSSIWRRVSGKTIRKITSTEERSVNVNLDLDIRTTEGTKVKFKMKGDFPDSLKEKCIDKAFQLISSKAFPEIQTGYICKYNAEENTWKIFEEVEFVRKFIKPESS